jgi:hypothetical protein
MWKLQALLNKYFPRLLDLWLHFTFMEWVLLFVIAATILL